MAATQYFQLTQQGKPLRTGVVTMETLIAFLMRLDLPQGPKSDEEWITALMVTEKNGVSTIEADTWKLTYGLRV